jgi:hypothetical protein
MRGVIIGGAVLAVVATVYLIVVFTTPQVSSLLDKQDADFKQMEGQLNELSAAVPDAISSLTKYRNVVRNSATEFSQNRALFQPANFTLITLAHAATEADVTGAILLLSNLKPAQTAEEAAVSLLKENAALYRQLWLDSSEGNTERQRKKGTISENNKRRDSIADVAERIVGDFGNIILKHEQQWLKLQNGVETLEALAQKDEETALSIKLQNGLLYLGSQSIFIEKKYHENLEDILSKIKGAIKVQDGLVTVIK